MSSDPSGGGGFETLGIDAQRPVQESMSAHDVDPKGHWLVVFLSILHSLLRMVLINMYSITSSLKV